MALSQIFKNIAAVLGAHGVGDTYALLDLTSKVNEIVVEYGAEEYDKGYSDGRSVEAAKHSEPLADWERELLGSAPPLNLSLDQMRLLRTIVGNTAGNHPDLMPLWKEIEKTTKDMNLANSNARMEGYSKVNLRPGH